MIFAQCTRRRFAPEEGKDGAREFRDRDVGNFNKKVLALLEKWGAPSEVYQ